MTSTMVIFGFSYSLFLVFLFSIFFSRAHPPSNGSGESWTGEEKYKVQAFSLPWFRVLTLPNCPLPPLPPSPPSPPPLHAANRWWKYSNLSWFNAKFSLLIYKEMSISQRGELTIRSWELKVQVSRSALRYVIILLISWRYST